MGDTSWRDRAVCRETDPELFFPTAVQGAVYEAQVAAAKRVCAYCPVRAECLAEALELIPDGIAGGMTAGERRRLRRARRPDPGPGEWLELGPVSGRDLARELSRRGRTARQIGWRCGVSVRTVERWLAAPPRPPCPELEPGAFSTGAGVRGDRS